MLPGLNLAIILMLMVILVTIGLIWLHHAWALKQGIRPQRPLPALDTLRAAIDRAAETGRAVHLSPGASVLGAGSGVRSASTELVAGLLMTERAASQAALNGAPILVSSGDAVAHLALRGGVRRAFQEAGQAQDFKPAQVQLLAHHDEMAYATGAITLYGREPLEASAMLGGFGQEFLLVGEDGAQRGLPQVAGTTSTAGLPLMLLTAPATLIGEEIYASEAYLAPSGPAQARLLTQDALRTAVIVVLIGGLCYSLIHSYLGLPPLPGL
ncbi:MAG: hypothetical protein RMK84_14040 [Oscillochloridaceae bacterium]|nr:hypothetical protein [Chloroflexaceae bacterium]MDW8391241.1 hypothetical protein [Oscillochloridaceae bacterium]